MSEGMQFVADAPSVPRIRPPVGPIVDGATHRRRDSKRESNRERGAPKKDEEGKPDPEGPKGKKIDIRA